MFTNRLLYVQVKKFHVENNLNGEAILLIDNASSHTSVTQLTRDDGYKL